MQKIVTSLWFDDQAEEAAEFYVSLFDNSRIVSVARYGEAGPREAGMAMAVDFELAGQSFDAISSNRRLSSTSSPTASGSSPWRMMPMSFPSTSSSGQLHGRALGHLDLPGSARCGRR